jgi:hypothetical protein
LLEALVLERYRTVHPESTSPPTCNCPSSKPFPHAPLPPSRPTGSICGPP